MRRSLKVLLMLMAVLLTLAGVVGGCGTNETAGVSSADSTPEGILTAAIAAAEGMSSATGNLEMTVSFDVDTAQLPEEAKALVEKPMTMSGTMAYSMDPQTADIALTAFIAGQTMDLGVKILDDKSWISFLGQWYEAPAEMTQALGDSTDTETKSAQVMQLLADLGINPMTWMKELRLVGEETLGEASVYHLAGTPDLPKMMTDLVQLMQSEEFMKLLGPAASADGLMGMGSAALPSTEDLQEMQTQIGSMFQELSVDLWIAKEDATMRKAAFGATMVPPEGEESAGLNGINIAATLTLDDINEPVSVQAPASAKPWTEFEKAMEQNPEMFMNMFGVLGAAGSM